MKGIREISLDVFFLITTEKTKEVVLKKSSRLREEVFLKISRMSQEHLYRSLFLIKSQRKVASL